MKLFLKYPYIIQQTRDENIQTYQVEAALLIWHQVLITDLQGNMLQLEGRIYNQVLGVRELRVAKINTPANVDLQPCRLNFPLH